MAAQIDAKADVSDLLAWQAVEIPLPVSGITAVSVAVNVADDISVGISSELRGVTVDMPLPWGKSAQASAPLQVIWRDRDWAAWEIFGSVDFRPLWMRQSWASWRLILT